MYIMTQVADLDLPIAQCTNTTFLFDDYLLKASTAVSIWYAILLFLFDFLVIGAYPVSSLKVTSTVSNNAAAFKHILYLLLSSICDWNMSSTRGFYLDGFLKKSLASSKAS